MLFSDLTSNPHIFNIITGNIFLYGSNYAKMNFLNDIQNVFSNVPFFDSVGSVGLLAIQIALFISKKNVPIFHTGLDFSQGAGFSHGKGSSNWYNMMICNNRLKSLYPSENIFPSGGFKLLGKENKRVFSTPILQAYANLYKKLFAHISNIFDIADSGIILRELTSEESAQKYIEDYSTYKYIDTSNTNNKIEIKSILEYLKREKEKLETLKNMLIGVETFDKEKFSFILKTSDYLYSHFADTSLSEMDISFLKRIRIEIEMFYKVINIY